MPLTLPSASKRTSYQLPTAVERERGTLYTDTGTSKGFTVDPNVKVVLTLSAKHGTDPFEMTGTVIGEPKSRGPLTVNCTLI